MNPRTQQQYWYRLGEALAPEWVHARRVAGEWHPDLETSDGGTALEVLHSPASMTTVLGSLMQLALYLTRSPARIGYLALWEPRMRRERLCVDWPIAWNLLASSVRNRLGIVAVWADDEMIHLRQPETERIARTMKQVGASAGQPSRRVDRRHEVLKALLGRWLTGGTSFRIGELQEVTGLSYPTVRRDLERLRQWTRRGTDRSVSLARFPTDAWNLLLALRDEARGTLRYMDTSGRPPDFGRLLSRIRKYAPSTVAVGGVHAARHWDPGLDLLGTPRIDLVLHTPGGEADMAFLRRVDPALAPTVAGDPSHVVVHRLYRQAPLFTKTPDGQLADPVETLLDLHELRLAAQAEALVVRLRARDG